MKRTKKENQNLQIAVFRSFWLVKKLSYCRRFHIVEASSLGCLGSNDALITIVESDLVAYIKSFTGEAVDGVALSVIGPDAGSSASPSASASATSGASTFAVTYKSTTIISVTSCSENERSENESSETQAPPP